MKIEGDELVFAENSNTKDTFVDTYSLSSHRRKVVYIYIYILTTSKAQISAELMYNG